MNHQNAGKCPVCGQEYAERVIVERGDVWSSIHAGTPLSFFRQYDRRCSSQRDVKNQRTLPRSKTAVYFHSESRPGGGVSILD